MRSKEWGEKTPHMVPIKTWDGKSSVHYRSALEARAFDCSPLKKVEGELRYTDEAVTCKNCIRRRNRKQNS